MLVDLDTLALACAVEGLMTGGERWKRELMQCQVEIATKPCRTCEEALEELAALRVGVAREANRHGLGVVAAGTHPFSSPQEQRVTGDARYRDLLAAIRYPVHQAVLYGMHVHVSVGGGDKALAVLEALVPDLPLLLAVSASSPFWCGEETGLASTRTVVGAQMPHTGLPPLFDDYGAFVHALTTLRAAGAVSDHTYLWWDARLHPEFGTVEVRIMDVQPRVHDSAAIAGLVQALVRHHGKAYDQGYHPRRADRFLVSENRWLAARHGLRAPMVTDQGARAARELVCELLDSVDADAGAVGAEWALQRVAEVTVEGTPSDRQLRAYRSAGDMTAIMRTLATETIPA